MKLPIDDDEARSQRQLRRLIEGRVAAVRAALDLPSP
jgi:hypothetical protein